MSALLDAFAEALPALARRDAAGLGADRQAALDAALDAGLPGPRSETWKFTPLRALERRAFAPSAASPGPGTEALAARLSAVPVPRLVFIDGHFDAAHSDVSALPAGVEACPLSQLLQAGDARAVSFLQRRYAGTDAVFALLNAALAVDGAIVRAAEGADGGTLHLAFVATGTQTGTACHLRHFFELRGNAALALAEHHIALGDDHGLRNHLYHVHLGQRARLQHVRLQDDADGASLFARTDAVLASAADYRRTDVELGASLSRHELNVRLEGEQAALAANGVLLADGRRHLDTRLGIEHIARDTRCDLRWRGLGTGRGRVVFHGGIGIREGADGADARLSNKNLLLSAQAEVDTQPVLVIHADEVQAAHGATVGQIDPTALFYLRSRGLPEAEARALLTAAFCLEALSGIGDAGLRGMLGASLDARLARMEAA